MADPDTTNTAIQIKDSFTQLGDIKKQFSPEQVKFVMETIAPTLNDKEIWLFLLKAQLTGLNPLNGEIFAYTAVKDGRRQLVMIAGRDGKRNLAERTGKIEYIRTTPIYTREQEVTVDDPKSENGKRTDRIVITVQPWEGKLWGAQCEIKRTDKVEATTVQVPLAEYQQDNYTWKNKPETMIKKVAQSQALSEAFPNLAGVYDESEAWTGDAKIENPVIEDGDQPASTEMMATLKALGAEEKPYTKQEATNEILRLNTAKRTKKPAR